MSEHHQSRCDRRGVERAIVLQLLRDDHEGQWSRAELEGEIGDVESSALSAAVELLAREGISEVRGEHVLASRCVRRLDELGLVSI
jgi:hypothetical protein